MYILKQILTKRMLVHIPSYTRTYANLSWILWEYSEGFANAMGMWIWALQAGHLKPILVGFHQFGVRFDSFFFQSHPNFHVQQSRHVGAVGVLLHFLPIWIDPKDILTWIIGSHAFRWTSTVPGDLEGRENARVFGWVRDRFTIVSVCWFTSPIYGTYPT